MANVLREEGCLDALVLASKLASIGYNIAVCRSLEGFNGLPQSLCLVMHRSNAAPENATVVVLDFRYARLQPCFLAVLSCPPLRVWSCAGHVQV